MITTMTSTNAQIKISLKKAIALSTICIAAVASSTLSVPSAFAQYGLGLPKSASSGGATRGDLPQLTILVPDDGAKTLSSRPTFYWYIAPANIASTSSTTAPQVDDVKGSFKVTFFLRDGNERKSQPVFVAEGKAEESGLYKFTLPESAPELVKGKVQRWQIRWQGSGGAVQVDVNAPIRRDDDPAVLKAIALAKNDLEKARIYAKNAYWYDAVDYYTIWLSQNPKDEIARTERNKLLKEGLQTNVAFSEERKGSLPILLGKLDESKPAILLVLQPKIRR
ncbi:MAG: hypothetical protein DCF20_04980 [Pseudanabaena sp.]|nr:MAG: hypothetical protein DCF20_04980 [Pseudanabaena sp.]